MTVITTLPVANNNEANVQTNSVCVSFDGVGHNLTADAALVKLEVFGDISKVDVRPEPEAAIVVSYFDVRAALKAKDTFGSACSFEPQHGQRAIRLLGSAGLDAAELNDVSDITKTEDGDFIVEFFDTRNAARAAGTYYVLQEHRDCIGEATVAADVSPEFLKIASPRNTASAGSKPRKIHDLRMSQLRWDYLANKREWRTTLHLRGLTKKLMEPKALETLLSLNGLSDAVARIKVVQSRGGKQLGCAILEATSVDQVQKLAKFFHGRQFGGSMPVAVSFASHYGNQSLLTNKKADKKTHLKHLAEPWRVDTSSTDFTSVPPGLLRGAENDESDSSSTTSEVSGGHMDMFEGTPTHGQASPCPPPPGLELFGQ